MLSDTSYINQRILTTDVTSFQWRKWDVWSVVSSESYDQQKTAIKTLVTSDVSNYL